VLAFSPITWSKARLMTDDNDLHMASVDKTDIINMEKTTEQTGNYDRTSWDNLPGIVLINKMNFRRHRLKN